MSGIYFGRVSKRGVRFGRGTMFGGSSGVVVPTAPTDILLSDTVFSESSGLGPIAVIGANGSPASTFSIVADPDNKFAISGSNLVLAEALDYETATSHTVTIRAANGVGVPHDKEFTIFVTDIVEGTAPTNIDLSVLSISEGAALNSTVAAIFANGSPAPALSIAADPDSKFRIEGTNLVLNGALDYETATSHTLTIRADNGIGVPYEEEFTINVTDVDEIAPFIQMSNPAPGATDLPVNQAFVFTFPEPVQWGPSVIRLREDGSTVETIDSSDAHAVIDGTTLTITPANPLSPGASVVFQFTEDSIRDLAGNPIQFVNYGSFTVAGAAPSEILLSANTIPEDTQIGSVVGVLTADGDPAPALTLENDPDNKFNIVGSNLVTTALFDFETKTSHQILVRAANGVGAPFDQPFTINISDVVESPTGDLTVKFGERTLEGAGGVPVTGADFASGNEAGHFAIVNGDLVVSVAGVGNLVAPYNLVLTDGQKIDILTIEPATYSCKADGAEIDAANVDHVLVQTDASTIAIRAGVVTNLATGDAGPGFTDERTWINRDFSTKHLTVKAANPLNQPEFRDWQLRCGGTTGITFDGLAFRHTDNGDSAATFDSAYISDGGVAGGSDINVTRCSLIGRDIDMTLDWFALHGTSFQPVGIVLSASSNTSVTYNIFRNLHTAAAVRAVNGLVLDDNIVNFCYFDVWKIIGADSDVSDGGTVSIQRNTGHAVFGARWNAAAGPHADFIQLVSGWLRDGTVRHNTMFMGGVGTVHNGDDQQLFFGSTGTGVARTTIDRNLLLGQTSHGITIVNAIDVTIEYNTIQENDPNNPVGQLLPPKISVGEGAGSSSGAIIIRNNIHTGGIGTGGVATFTVTGNVQVTRTGAGEAELVGDCFPGPFAPQTRAAALAGFTPIIASAVADIGAVDTGGAFRALAGASVPDQIGSGDFDVDTGSGPNELDITIINAPANNGAPIEDYEYDVNGSGIWFSLGIATPGTVTRTMAAASASYDIRVRAVNSVDPGPASLPKSAASGAAVGGGQSSSFMSPETNELNPSASTVTDLGKADGAGTYYIGVNVRHGSQPTNVTLAGVSAGAAIAQVNSDVNTDKLRIYKVTTTGPGDLAITLPDSTAIVVQATVWKTSGYTSTGLIANSNNTGVAGGPQKVTLPGVPDAALILMLANRNGGGNPIPVTAVSGTVLDHNAQIGSTSRGAAGRFVKSGAGDLDVTVDWGAANGDEIMLAVALPVA